MVTVCAAFYWRDRNVGAKRGERYEDRDASGFFPFGYAQGQDDSKNEQQQEENR